jgi:hypothetical protein
MTSILVSTRRGMAVRTIVEGGKTDFPLINNMVPDKRVRTRVLNACGEFQGRVCSRCPSHAAWKKVFTLFGVEYQAYTTAGNISLQIQHMIFKGASDPGELIKTAGILFRDIVDHLPVAPLLQLVVLQTSIGRSLLVKVGCLLDAQIQEQAPWACLCSRCEEVCNVVAFAVVDWDAACHALSMKRITPPPDTATISVTRRGVLTLRLTWVQGLMWVNNDALEETAETIARFVHDLV